MIFTERRAEAHRRFAQAEREHEVERLRAIVRNIEQSDPRRSEAEERLRFFAGEMIEPCPYCGQWHDSAEHL